MSRWRLRRSAAEPKGEGGGSGFERPERPPLATRLRAYFLTGVIVTAPISITIFLVWQFISFLDDRVEALLPRVGGRSAQAPA